MKKVMYFLLAGLSLFVAFVLISSDRISKLINYNWPPLSSIDQRYESILESEAIISNQDFVTDILVSINNDNMKSLVLPLIHKKLIKITTQDIEGISGLLINDIDLSFLPQGIRIRLGLNFSIDALGLPVQASASGDVSFVTKESGVLLKPALSNILIEPVNPIKEQWILITRSKESLVSQATVVLNGLLNNINGLVFKDGFFVPFDLNMTDKFSPNTIGTKDNLHVSGDDIPINISLPTLVVYINDFSFNILGSKSIYRKSTFNTSQRHLTETEFQTAFQQLEAQVRASLSKSFGDDYSAANKNSSALLRNNSLAEIINKHLNNISISIFAKDFLIIPKPGAPEDSNKFIQNIALYDKQALPSCGGLYREFKGEACDNPCSYSDISCDSNCKQGSCDGPCKMHDCPPCNPLKLKDCVERAACKAENAIRQIGCTACKTAKATEKAACDAKDAACRVERETRRVNCQRKNTECRVKRETDRIAHQAENEVRVAKCKADRLALKLVDDLVKLGEIKGEYWVNNSELKSNIAGIYISSGLDEIQVKLSVHASLDARLRVWVSPEGLGHIVCVFPFRKTLETHADYHDNSFTIKGVLSSKKDDNGDLILVGKTQPISLTASLSPSPYSQLIRDPLFLLNCTFLNMAIPTVAGAQLLKEGNLSDEFSTLFGRAKIDIEDKEFPFIVKPINIGKGQNALKLKPSLGKRTIKFEI